MDRCKHCDKEFVSVDEGEEFCSTQCKEMHQADSDANEKFDFRGAV